MILPREEIGLTLAVVGVPAGDEGKFVAGFVGIIRCSRSRDAGDTGRDPMYVETEIKV
jgi:hypothetical protein